VRRRRTVELFGDRRNLHRQGYLVVVSPASQIDDLGVVRVAQDGGEVALAQALAVAAQQLESAGAKGLRRHAAAAVERRRGPAHEFECLFTC
jgi:hypothetical protein